ncbi:hypothetical protein IFM89_030475 [Coptis chinensis]|uniref:3'-5' exonuclease domain-containing protein n=1 Tax=Coptis chinensis TaxID=261450 RepID=A0A835H6W1_9MAGN|nr:hypothetical protein IFM89_030475 [Coptis chinensis]
MFRQPSSTSSNVSSKYNVQFSGVVIETTVTNKGSTAEDWVIEIRTLHNGRRIILGLDCEWRCPDKWGYLNKVATLQLCVDNKCLIIQMVYMDYFPQSLKDFLNDPNVTCVGVEVNDDVSRIRNEYGLSCSSTADIRELASRSYSLDAIFMYKPKPGLKDLALLVAGLDMEKPRYVVKSDWQAAVLDHEQIRYACIDAYASHRIGRKLLGLGN